MDINNIIHYEEMIMEVKSLWPTPVGFGNFESLELAHYMLSSYDVDNVKSEVEGYNIFEDDTSYIQIFKKIAYNAFDDYLQKTIGHKITDWTSYKMKGWITGHGENYSMTIHNHSGAQLSAVFYVLAEDKNSGGDIVFSDPRSNSNRGYDEHFESMFEKYRHMPKTGEYVIFPSFTYHHVNPYYSKLRIAIPVDLYLHSN